MTKALGYRGYIGSRTVRGQDTPHQIQNMVVREYCRRNALLYLLSATEYSIPNCYMMLNELINSINHYDGIVLYSQFQLPQSRSVRLGIYSYICNSGKELHGALENAVMRTKSDIVAFEDTISVVNALGQAPMHGTYDKRTRSSSLTDFRNIIFNTPN